jgi:hypothetical protein
MAKKRNELPATTKKPDRYFFDQFVNEIATITNNGAVNETYRAMPSTPSSNEGANKTNEMACHQRGIFLMAGNATAATTTKVATCKKIAGRSNGCDRKSTIVVSSHVFLA